MLKLEDNNPRLYATLTNLLRRCWMTYATSRKEKLLECRVRDINPKTGRLKYYYKCERSGELIDKPQVHHIDPVGSIKDGVDNYLNRLFCGKDGLMVLSKTEHIELHRELKEKEKANNEN